MLLFKSLLAASLLALLATGCGGGGTVNSDHSDARATGAAFGAGAAAGATGRDAGTGGKTVTKEGGSTAGAGCTRSSASPAHTDASYSTGDAALQGHCSLNLPGPAMVKVPAPEGCTYCIDSTEVTNVQYAAFLSATGDGIDTSGQDPWCTWNTTYAPGESWPGDDYPVVSVDWCDAYAYCKWAGKHLCGKVGVSPVTVGIGTGAPAASEWYNACSKSGALLYPYGNSFDPAACNTSSAKPLPVPTKATCEGGYPGIFDLSGNVKEWVNSCAEQNGAGDKCQALGGGEGTFRFGALQVNCPDGAVLDRKQADNLTGFRCCSSTL
jgi:sulfatase modifying factor 1